MIVSDTIRIKKDDYLEEIKSDAPWDLVCLLVKRKKLTRAIYLDHTNKSKNILSGDEIDCSTGSYCYWTAKDNLRGYSCVPIKKFKEFFCEDFKTRKLSSKEHKTIKEKYRKGVSELDLINSFFGVKESDILFYL